MKSWLGLYKYRGHEKLSAIFGEMLEVPYQRYVQEIDAGKRPFDCLTFVPVSERRYRERGFNQAEQMARILGSRHRIPVIPLLQRSKHTDKQSFKSRAERLNDLHGVFDFFQPGLHELRQLSPHGIRRIALIDDVYTTGSTMLQCANVLSAELKTETYGISWAR